jgi:hypothetical protein
MVAGTIATKEQILLIMDSYEKDQLNKYQQEIKQCFIFCIAI